MMIFSNVVTRGEPSAFDDVTETGGKSAGLLWHSGERKMRLRSAETCFVEAGSGFPVVLLHGLIGYSFNWRKNIAALAERFRVLAPDLAGCGRSGPLREGRYGVARWSGQLEEFLDALGIRKAHLVGTSAGGAVALEFAARCPERVERMVLAAPVTPFSRRVVRLTRLYRWSGMPMPALKALVQAAPHLLPWLFRRRYYYDPSRISRETIPGYLEGLCGERTAQVLRESILDWDANRSAAEIARAGVPVLLLWGEQDKLIPPVCAAPLTEALPQASLSIIPRAGHFCYEERPESFNEHVLNFLPARPVSAGPRPGE